MIFAQSTELLDVQLNHHLPPNLAADEPSFSCTMKSIDINMAAYMSELAFLANPVSNHVQSAEMCNQEINSLALISARYTHSAVDIVSLMLSAHLYSICQALDLRAMNIRFMTRLKPAIQQFTARTFAGIFPDSQLSALHRSIWSRIFHALSITTSKDSSDRFICVADSTQHLIVQALEAAQSSIKSTDPLSLVTSWTDSTTCISKSLFLANREEYLMFPDATELLGSASKRMYNFVRKELMVPMHRGLVDHPTFKNGVGSASKRNTGTQVSIVYRALREERLVVPIMECLEEAVEMDKKSDVIPSKL